MRGGGEHGALIERSQLSAKRMLKMILDLLDVERLEERRLQPALDRLDARELVRNTIEEAEVPAAQRKVRLGVHAPRPVWVLADAALLRRVVDNLLSNAMSHSPSGGTVEVLVRHREEGVEIAVSDEGPGIPAEHRDTVFEKYHQIGGPDSCLADNRGLGLTFCRLAVEAQGGTIWIEDAPGGGARFVTLLPAAAAVEQKMPVEVPVPS
jgi:two-component system sensor histidine kinase/response regulator